MITVKTYRNTYEYKDAVSFQVKDHNLIVKNSSRVAIAAFSCWMSVHRGNEIPVISNAKDQFINAHMNLPEDDNGTV